MPGKDVGPAPFPPLAKATEASLAKLDAKALLALLVDEAFALGTLNPNGKGKTWDRVFEERYARIRLLQAVVRAALRHRACDARLAELVAKHAHLVAEAIEEVPGKVTIGEPLLAALAKRATKTGPTSTEGIEHEAVVKAILRAGPAKAFDVLAPIVRAWKPAGQAMIDTLGQDVEDMAKLKLDPRWREILHALLVKKRLTALAVLAKLPRTADDVGPILAAIAKAKFVPETAILMLIASGDRRALPALLAQLEAFRLGWKEREVLFPAIAKLGDATAIDPLVRYIARAEEDGDDARAKAARAALKKLGAAKPAKTAKRVPQPQPYAKAGRATPVPTTTIDEERKAAAKQAGEHAAKLRAAIRIYTKRVADDALPLGTSRFGGLPDLPPKTAWPRGGEIPMTFLAQFDLAELAPYDVDKVLPKRGLLSFFLHDESPADGVDAPDMYSTWRVLYTMDTKMLVRASVPENFIQRYPRKPLATAALRFHTGFELPSELGTNEPRPKTLNQLLGHADNRGYEDPPKGLALFRCDSDDQADMNFGDAQDIAYFIAAKDLAAAKFDRVTLWFQPG